MTQLITTNNQQHVSNITDDVGITLLHLRPNVITLRSLLHLRAVITFRSPTPVTAYKATTKIRQLTDKSRIELRM